MNLQGKYSNLRFFAELLRLALREERDAAERLVKKNEIKRAKEIEAQQIAEKKKEQELRSYSGLVDDDSLKVQLH